MNKQELKEQIQDYMDDHIDDCDMVEYWNNMCDDIYDNERIIYDMYVFDDMMDGKKPTDIIESVDDDFSTRDTYFCDDIYGIKSFDDIYDVVDTDELIEYMIDNNESFGDWDIQQLLDEYDESED